MKKLNKLEGQNSLIKKALSRRRLSLNRVDLSLITSIMGDQAHLWLILPVSRLEKQWGPRSRGKYFPRCSLEDAKNLQQDEIMIAGYTDIGWSPYYAIIGLVTIGVPLWRCRRARILLAPLSQTSCTLPQKLKRATC